MKTRETEEGIFDWNENGYWVKREEDPTRQADRIPLACPCCNNLLDNWTSNFFLRWGVCSDCYYDFLHGRQNLPQFRTNKDRASYCKEKFEEKRQKA